jgi:hypothetical protein
MPDENTPESVLWNRNIGAADLVFSFGCPMGDTSAIKVLLVGDSPQSFFLHQKHLEKNGCECEFVKSERTAWEMLGQRQFDLVLSLHPSREASCPSLGVLLSGSQTTLFYALRVEVGYWWVPMLRLGEECFGAPVLRPSEFANSLDELIKEIRADGTWSENPIQTE